MAAEKIGVHRTRIQALIRTGRLPAQLIGGTYVIEEKDLALVAERKPGRPPMTGEEKAREAAERGGRAGDRTPSDQGQGQDQGQYKEDRCEKAEERRSEIMLPLNESDGNND